MVTLRIGLLGTGPWAEQAHAPGLAAHDGVEFAGVWGRTASRAAALADRYGVRTYDTAEGLIADVEAVAVALPPDVQAPLALQAARAGRHLLLDKPVAMTVAAAEDLAEATAALSTVVFFTRRFMPPLRRFLDDAVTTGGWVEARVDHVGTIYDEGNPFGASPWRRESGGLWDVGPHALALVLPVLGPVHEVTAMVAPHDMTYLLLRHRSGGVSRITLSLDVPPAAAREEAVFYGEAGIRSAPDQDWDPVQAYGVALDDLIGGASGGPTIGMDVRFGAEVTTVLAAGEEAARTGRTVAITQ